MRIAVTGATGFLGRYLVRRLGRAGHKLRCWHRPNSDRSGFGDVADAIEWLPGTLTDAEATAALVRQTDAVVHAAVDWAGRRNRAREGGADLSEFLHRECVHRGSSVTGYQRAQGAMTETLYP